MSQQHILKKFDTDLEDLRSRVLAMGGFGRTAIPACHGWVGKWRPECARADHFQ
jgi:hypothetical protein